MLALVLALSLAGPVRSAAQQPGALERSSRIEDLLPGAFGSHRYDVWMGGKCVGWKRRELVCDRATGQYLESYITQMNIDRAGKVLDYKSSEFARYSATPPHRVLWKQLIESNDGRETSLELMLRHDGAAVVTRSAAGSTSLEVHFVEETLEGELRDMKRAIEGGGPFERVSNSLVDGVPKRNTLARGASERVDGIAQPLFVLEVRREGFAAVELRLVDATGLLHVQRLGAAVELRLADGEPPRASRGSVSALADASVPVSGLDGNPKSIDALKLEWSGAVELLPARDFQRVSWSSKEQHSQTIEIERVRKPTQAERSTPIPSECGAELAADPLIQSDHAAIRAAAQVIVGNERDPWFKTTRVVEWVASSIAFADDANSSSAADVLAARRGDCTEHTLIACALLRASGVPTRQVGGLAYAGPTWGVLAPHAWIEVWIGRWIPVDPTWNEAPVDATHVYLGGIDDGASMVSNVMSAKASEVARASGH